MAARKGFEPLTSALGKRCSILLSYRADEGCIPFAGPARKCWSVLRIGASVAVLAVRRLP